ncbi:hypothetical protein FD755_023422 [Muntiacus reevesi]|uniref:ABC transmembrane type-1 domain-containing protein n=1 Tax=Muntiacus reevesi TaxID=9886 RepID=A0A5N3VWY8_MUNRE|nr:hypothetical protein FD755_023422 [Muntiacus reevesi]
MYNVCSVGHKQPAFKWLNPLFKIGHKRRLEEDDMYSVLPEDRSQRLGEELQGYWDQEVKRAQKDAQEPSLMKAIIKCYWKSYLIWGVFTFLEEGTRVVQPIFLGKMVSYVENYDPNDSAALHEAYGYAAGLSACVFVWAVLHHLYFYHIQHVGMRLRVAVCHMIYRKVLRLSSSAMGKTTTGQIVNLLSNDVSRFDQVTMFLHYLWVGPLQAIAVTTLLWMEIGMPCLAGMAVLIMLLLLQSCFGKLFSSLRSKTAALTDDRISTMSEVITGIRTIKMNAWEKSFIDLITRLRRQEISKILRSSYLRGMNLASFFAVSKIMIFVTFITSELLENLVTARQVFVVVTLFEALRCSSTLYFPMAIEKVSEAVVSIRRIKKFLLLDEITQCYPLLPSDGKTIVDMQAFTASWEKASETPTLQGLSFTVRPGELLAVVGHVGAGKSSLLSALLGELPPSQGTVSVHGRIAYVSQQPWVFPGTVRSNILFGKKYKEDRYEEIIRACALEENTLSGGGNCFYCGADPRPQFSSSVHVCVCVCVLSHFNHWSGLLFPSLGDLPNPGIKPVSLMSPALAGGYFTTSTTWEALHQLRFLPAVTLDTSCYLPVPLMFPQHNKDIGSERFQEGVSKWWLLLLSLTWTFSFQILREAVCTYTNYGAESDGSFTRDVNRASGAQQEER